MLPDLFQRYKAARICHLHSFRDGITTTSYTQRNLTYGGPAFDPSRVLLRRLFILNDDKSRYVSVGFYPAHNYQPLVEFGGTRILPLSRLPTMSTLWSNDCQVSWKQCVGTNALCGDLRTGALK